MLTQDTRDGGVDIWATKNIYDQGKIVNRKYIFSVKKYSYSICPSTIDSFLLDLEKYDVIQNKIIPCIVSSSSYTKGSKALLNKNQISYYSRSNIIDYLIDHCIGVSHCLQVDFEFWLKLNFNKTRFLNGPLWKYPVGNQNIDVQCKI